MVIYQQIIDPLDKQWIIDVFSPKLLTYIFVGSEFPPWNMWSVLGKDLGNALSLTIILWLFNKGPKQQLCCSPLFSCSILASQCLPQIRSQNESTWWAMVFWTCLEMCCWTGPLATQSSAAMWNIISSQHFLITCAWRCEAGFVVVLKDKWEGSILAYSGERVYNRLTILYNFCEAKRVIFLELETTTVLELGLLSQREIEDSAKATDIAPLQWLAVKSCCPKCGASSGASSVST